MTAEQLAKLCNLLTPVTSLLDELSMRSALKMEYGEAITEARSGLTQVVAIIREEQRSR